MSGIMRDSTGTNIKESGRISREVAIARRTVNTIRKASLTFYRLSEL